MIIEFSKNLDGHLAQMLVHMLKEPIPFAETKYGRALLKLKWAQLATNFDVHGRHIRKHKPHLTLTENGKRWALLYQQIGVQPGD